MAGETKPTRIPFSPFLVPSDDPSIRRYVFHETRVIVWYSYRKYRSVLTGLVQSMECGENVHTSNLHFSVYAVELVKVDTIFGNVTQHWNISYDVRCERMFTDPAGGTKNIW